MSGIEQSIVDTSMTSDIAEHSQQDFEIVRGEGSYLFDVNRNRYLDFCAGWCVGSVGWGNKQVPGAIAQNAENGTFCPLPSWHHTATGELAEILTSRSPGRKLTWVFRCTIGFEAVEFAIKCARAATGRKTIVSIEDSYHGHTYGAASLGNECDPKTLGYCLPGFKKISMPNAHRDMSGKEVIEEFQKFLEGKEGEDAAAIVSEPVWTNVGVIVPSDDFFPAIEKLCRKHGVMLVIDEVPTSCGLCGSFYANEQWGIEPDTICLAKGLTGGYGTMGARLVTEDIFKKSRDIPAYSTFGWLPQDLAASRAVIDSIVQQKLWENGEKMGYFLLDGLKSLEESDWVGEVRGRGLVIGVEIVKDTASKKEDLERVEAIAEICHSQGLIIETANTLFIAQSLTLTERKAAQGAEILKTAVTTGAEKQSCEKRRRSFPPCETRKFASLSSNL